MKKSTKIIIITVVVIVLAAVALLIYIKQNRDYWESSYAYCRQSKDCPKFWCKKMACGSLIAPPGVQINDNDICYSGQTSCWPRF